MGRPHKEVVNGFMQCCRCRALLPCEAFSKSNLSPLGRSTICRKCKSQSLADKCNDDLGYAAGRMVAANKATRKRSERRARLGSESKVTVDLILSLWNSQDGKCAVTGLPMTHIYGQGMSVMTNASLDRIDNGVGYEPENLRLVCKIVNYMKHTMDDQELLAWCSAVLNGPLAATQATNNC